MSKEDLKPCRTPQEAKERGRNGGLASGKARREKKALRELVRLALEEKYKSSFYSTALEKEMDGKPLSELIAAKLVHKAADGDLKAMSMLFNLEAETMPKQDELEIVEA